MTYDPRKHHRRSIRLRGHDYAGGGAYFVTICLRGDDEWLFGQILEGEMILNEAGQIVQTAWDALRQRFGSLAWDAFQIMPDHAHAIIVMPGPGLDPSLANATGVPIMHPSVGPGLAPAPALAPAKHLQGRVKGRPYLSDVVGAFKSISAINVNRLLSRVGRHVWQEDYYEHVIRDVGGLEIIRD